MFRKRWRPKSEEDAPRLIKDQEGSRERTMTRAVKLLAAKPRSVAQLRERLLEKSWTDENIVDGVLAKLKDYKYLDDEQFAGDLAISRLRQKPQGERRLKQTMSQKKLDKEIVEKAIQSAFEKLPESELLERAIEKRVRLKGKPETRADLKKFYDYLMRQGFGYDLIRTKMDATLRGIL
ncbi:MAG: RecX family transcriptional regulator [Acidobacteria bacterium]|nr:RecX family transcriptional regulator [Acidobacteriota bacterium]